MWFGFAGLIQIGSRLAGILIENIQSGPGRHRLIIGIGLNVFSKPDLPTAICLADSIEASVIESRWSEFLMELFLIVVTSLNMIRSCWQLMVEWGWR